MDNLIHQVGYWRVCQDAGKPVRNCLTCPLSRSSGYVDERDPGNSLAQEPLTVCAIMDELNEIGVESQQRTLSDETDQMIADLRRVDDLDDDDQSRCRIALMLLISEHLRYSCDEQAREYHKTYLKLGGYTTWEKELEIAGRS